MKKLLLLLLITFSAFGQVGINTSNPQAVFDIYSTTSGVLIPRLTTVQKNLIQNPVISMLVFDSDLNIFNYYNGDTWQSLSSGFVPLSGTSEPISGDLELTESDKNIWIKGNNYPENYYSLSFMEGGISFNYSDSLNGNKNIYFDNQGLKGSNDFSQTELTNKLFYAQRSYVDNQSGKLQQLSTTEILAITTPEIGKLYYNTTSKEIVFYNGVEWRKISNSGM